MTAPALEKSTLSPRAFGIIFSVALMTSVANTALQSVLPAVGRQVGMADTMVAAISSFGAVVFSFMSPYWGRRADRTGRKPMMMLGMIGGTLSMLCSGIAVALGVLHIVTPLVFFALYGLSRAINGFIGSAANPATQAYVAERTTREERTQRMAGLAGAGGFGTIIGPALAPLFVLPVVGLAGPSFIFTICLAATFVVLWRFLPADPGPHAPAPSAGRITPAAAGKGAGLWNDPRLKPFLIFSFFLASCQTGQAQTLGFVIIDKTGLPPLQAQGFTAVALMAGAVSGLLAQWGLIAMFKMTPRTLLRWGAGLAAVANLLTAFAPNYWTVVIGFALASLGYGLARPGFTAGASLAVNMDEQARAAGAIAAVGGATFIIAPVLCMSLYEISHAAPFLMNMTILIALLAYARLDPTLRAAGAATANQEDSIASTLERNDEGGPTI